MSTHRQMEREAYPYLSFHQDGLADILIALILLGFGLSIKANMVWLTGVIAGALAPVWYLAKTQITVPRLEQAALEPDQMRRNLTARPALFAAAIFLGLAIFALLAFSPLSGDMWGWLRSNADLALGLFLAIFLAVSGVVFGANRFYVYAVFTLALYLAAGILALPVWMNVIISAVTILLTGLLILANFVRRSRL